MAVAVYKQSDIEGEVEARAHKRGGTYLIATFSRLPPGKHGFHIHVAGDLRGEGCAGACAHYHVGSPADHGDCPSGKSHSRHSGDLGNIELKGKKSRYTYHLPDVKPEDLWGRSLIVHADEDDLGLGPHEDSKTTGHSGARIGCAIFGRLAPCAKKPRKTRKARKIYKSKQRGGSSFEVVYNSTNVGGFHNNPTSLTVAEMATEPKIHFNLNDDAHYSLIMYDPDAVGQTPGTKATFLHLLTVNKTKSESGDMCVSYYPPKPPKGSGLHRYIFELYKQKDRISCVAPTRSSFDLKAYLDKNNLESNPLQTVMFEVQAPN